MNIYKKKIRWKFFLFICAVTIGAGSLWYTNSLVKKLAIEEQKKIALWAKATSLIPNANLESESLGFLFSVIQNNETVPVILVESDTTISLYRNLDSTRVHNPEYLNKKLEKMMEENPPIEIPLSDNNKQYLYYSRSTILTSLTYYPWIQLGVILIFIGVAYFAFSSSRKAEQNQVWVGLSKETAHQLGTPISSLMAWLEMLKLKNQDDAYIGELEKDVLRLKIITERFSKIGSPPVLKPENLVKTIENSLHYLKTRSSEKISFELQADKNDIILPLNTSLFEWVIENVCKNAMDAIGEKGNIKVTVTKNSYFVFVDISDTGKGISKSKYKTIFKPGFTTKDRGWGLGLSLTKRIIEEYHKGKIFVAESDIGKGTTIRIILKTS
ncbi:MAG: HAMP domain-containing histidine kinase [Bacteroidales bacterium]|nr:HAMP domain-containing histidine kinase [Bacteroidales bacterium]